LLAEEARPSRRYQNTLCFQKSYSPLLAARFYDRPNHTQTRSIL
jgi:hypothetical protein